MALRRACFLCLVLSGLVGLVSAVELNGLAYLQESLDVESPVLPLSEDPQVSRKLFEAQASALVKMRVPRVLTLIALSFCCGFSFVGALRLLRPRELPRTLACRILGGATLWAGIVRTIDGAQAAAVFGRVASTASELLASQPPPQGSPDHMLLQLMATDVGLVAAVLQTAVMAGSLVLLAQYFRSQRVAQMLAAP